uniref:Uncharacterized protein n=1 Tax=Alexandrium monilatum TaxID=311494 RepID=A0A7S4RCV7_9DINO
MSEAPDVSVQLLSLKRNSPEALSTVTIDFEGRDEYVAVHPEFGPIINRFGGGTEYLQHYLGKVGNPLSRAATPLIKKWPDLTPTEGEVLVHIAAKMNRRVAERSPFAIATVIAMGMSLINNLNIFGLVWPQQQHPIFTQREPSILLRCLCGRCGCMQRRLHRTRPRTRLEMLLAEHQEQMHSPRVGTSRNV